MYSLYKCVECKQGSQILHTDCFSSYCSRLEETPENDLKQELEEILQLLVGHAKDSSTHLSSIPAPSEPTDRSAT